MIGLANKLMPQIPVYFIATPFIVAGGFIILYFTIGESLRLFMMGFIGLAGAGLSMSKETRRTARILDLQQQLHRIERWKLLDLQRRSADLDTLQQELIAALNNDDALQGLFIDATARRLTSLALEADEVERQEQAQGERVGEQGARVVCAERLHETVMKEDQRIIERESLLESIDRLVGAATQASRKIGSA